MEHLASFVNEKKKALIEKVIDKQTEVNKLLTNAPFRRELDKYFFVYGLCLLVITSWLVGAYPGTHFLTFIRVMTPLQVFYRTFVLYEHKSLFYLTDFCYYSTSAFLYFITFDTTNDALFRMVYVHANGSQAVAVWAFNTQFIVHNPNNLTGMFIHAIPFVATNLIKWKLIPEEAHLPLEERIWPTMSEDEDWLQYIYYMLIIPIAFYLAWLLCYTIFTIYLCGDYVKRNGMKTM